MSENQSQPPQQAPPTQPIKYKMNIVGVPLASEDAFKPIQNNMDFLRDKYYERHYTKHVVEFKEYERFMDHIIVPIQKLKTEYYVSLDYAPKTNNQSTLDYLTNYIKIRNLNSYYTFHEWYNVVVNFDNVQEDWYIIPLYIRLKNNKTFDQMRTLRYVPKSDKYPDGFVVEHVNKRYFKKDPSDDDVTDNKEEEEGLVVE